jgi:hypothetical protein
MSIVAVSVPSSTVLVELWQVFVIPTVAAQQFFNVVATDDSHLLNLSVVV